MFLRLNKEISIFNLYMRLRSNKEINRLISKGMSNNYLKLTFSELQFFKSKNLSPSQFLANSNSSRYN